MKINTPLLPPAACLAPDVSDSATAAEAAKVEGTQESAALAAAHKSGPYETTVRPSTTTSHTALRRGGIAVHSSITARRGTVKESGIQPKQEHECETQRCPSGEHALRAVDELEAGISGPHSIEGFGLALMEYGIEPTVFNRRIYKQALMLEGREIAFGLGGVLVDNTAVSQDPHRIVQRVHMKLGAEALLLGLQKSNSLSLYTHEPAMRVARILSAFPTLARAFACEATHGKISSAQVKNNPRIMCLETQIRAINAILRKVETKATLREWESDLLHALRHENVTITKAADLRSSRLAASLMKADVDTFVAIERQAWRMQPDSHDTAMLLMPARTDLRSEVPKDDTLLSMLTMLAKTNTNGAVVFVDRGRHIEGEKAPEAEIELPSRISANELEEFESSIKLISFSRRSILSFGEDTRAERAHRSADKERL